MELKGRTAVITGSCGQGMGRSTALRLAREGANIVLNYGTHSGGKKTEAHAKKVADAVAQLGGRAIVQQADTRDEDQVKGLVEAACEEFGGVDILVNNAGGDWVIRDYTTIDLAEWRSVLAAEIDGAFLTMKHIVPGMRERKWGRVIHLGLQGALHMTSMRNVAPDYCLGKAARAWMTTAFGSQELAHGISVNCIEPGIIPHMTFGDAKKVAGGSDAAWRKRKNATCHDVAELVAFLCSEAGRFISGNTIRIGRLP